MRSIIYSIVVVLALSAFADAKDHVKAHEHHNKHDSHLLSRHLDHSSRILSIPVCVRVCGGTSVTPGITPSSNITIPPTPSSPPTPTPPTVTPPTVTPPTVTPPTVTPPTVTPPIVTPSTGPPTLPPTTSTSTTTSTTTTSTTTPSTTVAPPSCPRVCVDAQGITHTFSVARSYHGHPETLKSHHNKHNQASRHHYKAQHQE